MQLIGRQHHIAAGIGLLVLVGFAVTNAVGQVTTQETGSSAINISTDPVTNVKETEATFQATLTGFDNTDYDAALIYWNYSEDSSYNQPGPMTVENTETQRSVFHPDLAPDTSYNVEAYAEPIVWDDPTLMKNYGDTLARSSFSGEYPAEFKPDLSQTYTQYSDTTDVSISVAQDMAISRDGKRLTTLYSYTSYNGFTSTSVNLYNLSDPWNLNSSELYTSKSPGLSSLANGLHVSSDGNKMVISSADEKVWGYDLSEPWDMSSASQTSSMTLDDLNPTGDGVFFTPKGDKMYLSEVGGEVRFYSLAEPWNLSTASEEGSITSLTGGDGISFSDGGSKMLLSDSSGSINSYDLSNSWDINSYSTGSSISVSGNPNGIALGPSGDRIFYSENDVFGLNR